MLVCAKSFTEITSPFSHFLNNQHSHSGTGRLDDIPFYAVLLFDDKSSV